MTVKFSGACVGSVNYKHDLYSKDTSTNILTDIVSLKLYDPEQSSLLIPGTLSSSFQVQIPLRNADDTKYFFVVSFFPTLDHGLISRKSCQPFFINFSLHHIMFL